MVQSVKHLDCTIRDGGYLNNWDFSFPLVYRLLRVLDEAGFDYAEVGFWNPKEQGKLWKHCDIELLKSLEVHKLSIKLVLIMDFGSCTLDQIPDELAQHIGLIRIASHKKDLEKAVEFASALKTRGFSVTINAMGITSYSQADLIELARLAQKSEDWCDYFYIADSFGGLVPDDAARLFHFLTTASNGVLGFHPHNNLELAVANTLAALNSGARIVDSSLLGLGRGGGNLRSEIIAAVLARTGKTRLNPLPLLSFADAMFDQIGKALGLAYDLEQVISGMAQCHPNYASSLIGPKRLALDEVYKVIDAIPVQKKSMFSEVILEEMIQAAKAVEMIETGVHSNVLRVTGKNTVALICPGESSAVTEIPSGTPAFSVNHIPSGIELTGVLFGSLRRLWQYGDLIGKNTPLYLASTSQRLKSLPDCTVIATQSIIATLGIELRNSGIRALAILLDAGYKHVDVYGMTGFTTAGTGGDESIGVEVRQTMDLEARKELSAVQQAYAAHGATFTIHNSVLSKETI